MKKMDPILRTPLLGILLCAQVAALPQATVAPTKVYALAPATITRPLSVRLGGAANDKICFTTSSNHGAAGSSSALYSTSGTAAGVMMHEQRAADMHIVESSGDIVYYRTGGGYAMHDFVFRSVSLLSKMPPTPITPVLELVPAMPSCVAQQPRVVNGNLLCAMDWDPATKVELVAVPPPGGTNQLVKDIEPGKGSGLFCYNTQPRTCSTGDRMFFPASTNSQGPELWVSDGTTAGTQRHSNFVAGADGTIVQGLTAVGNRVYMSASDQPQNYEPYTCTSAPGSVTRLKEIAPGALGSAPADFTALDSTVFFTANDGTNGRELWKTNGTTAGTVMVKDLRAGAGSNPHHLMVFNGLLYFFAHDGITKVEKLFRSDGTAANTVPCIDLPASTEVRTTTVGTRKMFYVLRSSDGLSSKLWSTDGTPAGTKAVVPTTATIADPYEYCEMVSLGGWLYFMAKYDASGYALWKVQ